MSSLAATAQVTDDQMRRYAKMIYDVAGIEISPAKKQLLSNRIRRRLKESGIADFEQYYNFLNQLPISHAEWDGFLQEVTTHETYLFRDDSNWKWLRGTFLPEFQKAGKNSLRVWSAASSTGDEAYSIATCIADGIRNLAALRVQILGTDIGVGAVQDAQEAKFNERAMRLVPDDLKRRYFGQMGGASIWEPNAKLRAMTKFRQHNLLDRLAESPFDLVFLKNVLIYFNTDSKKRVMRNVEQVMKPGSYLVAGAAEGISDLMSGFERIHPWLYLRK
ncbi:CheR family methyltransferase [Bremerella sp.]|uniref:CheR family methyltransferase n=1 Tax=Bremerella sp. TaxID=2795602 RepID=UPI00391CE883